MTPTPEQLREMGLDATRMWPVHRHSVQHDLPPFSGSDMTHIIDAADRMRDELLTRLEAEAKRADEAEDNFKTTAEACESQGDLIAELQARLAAVERERDRWEWVAKRAVMWHFNDDNALVYDVVMHDEQSSKVLLAEYNAANPAPEEEADRG